MEKCYELKTKLINKLKAMGAIELSIEEKLLQQNKDNFTVTDIYKIKDKLVILINNDENFYKCEFKGVDYAYDIIKVQVYTNRISLISYDNNIMGKIYTSYRVVHMNYCDNTSFANTLFSRLRRYKTLHIIRNKTHNYIYDMSTDKIYKVIDDMKLYDLIDWFRRGENDKIIENNCRVVKDGTRAYINIELVDKNKEELGFYDLTKLED